MALPRRGSYEPACRPKEKSLSIPLTHSQRPRPGRRRRSTLCSSTAFPIAFLITIILIFSFPSTSQASYLSPRLRRLAERGLIEIDRRPLPAPVDSPILPRQDDSSSSTQGPTSTATSTSAAASSTSIDTAPSSAPSSAALPTPFDTSIGSNFTSNACPDFFNKFLANTTFQQCHPLSLLLENSNSFFQASGSAVLLTQALDASCAADLNSCNAIMKDLASQLISDDHCGPDYTEQNPIVLQAHAGLEAYQPVYQASCIKSAKSGQYCFVDAMSSSDNLSDTYPYYLGIGLNLPGGSRPTCDKCLQDTMAVFANAARDKNQPVSTVYTQAAQQIDLGCGPTFVNSTVPVATTKGSSGSVVVGPTSGFLGMLVAVVVGALVLI
ncbi:MAG: hypothetical protein Q9227_002431 [Pyrenula ochraceoflavens]